VVGWQPGMHSWHSVLTHRVKVSPLRLQESSAPPPEVIEAEANATPNRKWRLLGVGTGFALSSASGVLDIATISGAVDTSALAPLILFDNPTLSLVINFAVGSTCAWAWQQEQETKRQNVQRIWDEVQRRRNGGAASGANRAQRRAKKVAVPAAPPGAAGFGALASEKRDGRTASPAPPTTPPSPPPAATPPTPAGTPNQDSGIFGGVKSFFDEANAIGKAQAITLNSKLEDAGVLSPVAAGDGDSKAASVDSADAMQSTSSTDAGVTALPADNTLTTKGQAKGRKGNNKKGNQRKKKSKA